MPRWPGSAWPSVRSDLRPARDAAPGSWSQDARAGLVFLTRHRFARTAVVLIAVSNLVFQALVLVLIVLVRDRGAGAAATGLMLGIYGGGGVAGALAAVQLARRLSPRAVVVGANWMWAALLPLFALPVPSPVAPVTFGLIGAVAAFVGPVWNVVIGNLALLLIPDDLRGRVLSAVMMLSAGALPLGSLAAGVLLSASGPVTAVLVLGGVMLVAAIAGTVSRALQEPSARNGHQPVNR